MAVGGLVALFFAVPAHQRSLEHVARPLSMVSDLPAATKPGRAAMA